MTLKVYTENKMNQGGENRNEHEFSSHQGSRNTPEASSFIFRLTKPEKNNIRNVGDVYRK